jgi:septal ring factor EnvC (AmiA/AmiB activator)
MKIVELKKAMDAGFEQVDAQFAQVDAQFAQVDARFDQVDARFAQVDARFGQVDARLGQVDLRFDRLEARMATEHETTLRHMDMLFEQLKAEYRLGFDRMLTTDERLASLDVVNASEHTTFAAVLDEHEVRIKALESSSTLPEDPPPNRQ